jgi:hypothetical protein
MAGQVLSALEASRAVIANMRVSVHVDLDSGCWSIFGVVEVGGLWSGTVGFGKQFRSQPASAESQSSPVQIASTPTPARRKITV